MAIITTKFTIGWFGTASASGEDNCESFNLTQKIGTYTNNPDTSVKTFQRGDSLTSSENNSAIETKAEGLVIYGYTSSGAPQVWSLAKEKDAFWPNLDFLGNNRGRANRNSIAFTKNSGGDCILACGRMYVIINNEGLEVDIPGFIPSADGVDMGRIDTTIVG
jgi:hypothetical protein